MSDFIEQIQRALRTGDVERRDAIAVARVVATTGSTYRGPGATQLCFGDGSWTGSISGGCLEGDVAARSREVVASGRPLAVLYDEAALADEVLGLGLGCDGTVEVLIEPLAHWADHDGPRVLERLARNRSRGVESVLAATLPESGPHPRVRRALIEPEGDRCGSLGDPMLDDLAAKLAAERSRTSGAPRVVEVRPGAHRLWVEVVPPPIHLVVYGAGHDAQALVRLAQSLDMRISVFDHRRALCDRFGPVSADRVACIAPGDLARRAGLDRNAAVIVMSHHSPSDREALASLAGACEVPGYVGLLGPRARSQRLLRDLEASGVGLGAALVDRLHSPTGLDLGSETPEEVALSVLAEVLAVHRGREGGALRARPGPIHERGPVRTKS
ncbi:MAG: XdhC family protein [Myxococcota bacterium]